MFELGELNDTTLQAGIDSSIHTMSESYYVRVRKAEPVDPLRGDKDLDP